MFSDKSESTRNNDSFFSVADQTTSERTTNAFAKCLDYMKSLEGNSKDQLPSRSLYKSIKAADGKMRSLSKRSEPRGEEILGLKKEIKDLNYKLKEKDLEIKELVLQIQEKERENIELATSYEIEIEALKRDLLLSLIHI